MISPNQIIKQYRLHPDHSRGQNFLIDEKVLAKIVGAGELTPQDTVVEIGAGLGVLTIELAQRAGHIIAVEVDKKLALILRENLLDFKNVEIINDDALLFDMAKLSGNYKFIASIPYNITSAIIEKFLSAENPPQIMVLLVQKEVAERILARPGQMSLLSVATQFYGQPRIIAQVPASAFFPAPKVASAILKISAIKKHGGYTSEQEKCFFQLAKMGFVNKRKTLYNNLKQLGATAIAAVLAKMGLKSTVRAQELSVEQWLKLVEEFHPAGRRGKVDKQVCDIR